MNATPFGHYRLQKLIGQGGMGEVYQAYDTKTDRVVALKVLPHHMAQDATFQARFRRESQAAAGINDPVKVTRSALQNAASIAGLFLTTEAVVADKPEKAAAGAEGMDPMGGMGGMM